MNDWWSNLDTSSRFFWIIAIAASLFQILLFFGSFFGGDDFDHSVDGPDGPDTSQSSGAEGLKLLSLRAIVAFLVGFGWVGALALNKGSGVLIATTAAWVAGMIFMSVIALVFRLMMGLRDDGTIEFANAVGHSGQVYVTIPPARSGRGQVEILIQGRLATLQAITESPKPLTPNTPVTVTRVEAGNVLVVSPA